MVIPASWAFVLSALVFSIGAAGLMIRKNAIVMFLCVELMLNAANLFFIAASKVRGSVEGHVFVLFMMAIAAAEAAVGMAIIIAFYRRRGGVEVDRADLMKW